MRFWIVLLSYVIVTHQTPKPCTTLPVLIESRYNINLHRGSFVKFGCEYAENFLNSLLDGGRVAVNKDEAIDTDVKR